MAEQALVRVAARSNRGVALRSPYQRLLEAELPEKAKMQLRAVASALDPLKLLEEIRAMQAHVIARARNMLSAKGHSRPSEDLIFKTTDAQRRIERGAAHKSRHGRRNLAKRPTKFQANPPKPAEPAVNYDQTVTSYAGEEW